MFSMRSDGTCYTCLLIGFLSLRHLHKLELPFINFNNANNPTDISYCKSGHNHISWWPIISGTKRTSVWGWHVWFNQARTRQHQTCLILLNVVYGYHIVWSVWHPRVLAYSDILALCLYCTCCISQEILCSNLISPNRWRTLTTPASLPSASLSCRDLNN